MDRSILVVLGLAAVAVAQDPFVPLDLSAPGPVLKSVTGLGFTRMIVRNPETGQAWAARLERGRAVLER
jgi:hypothetical protein